MERLFYQRESIGDILLLLIDPEARVDEVKRNGDVALLYSKGKLVGANLFHFSEIVKIKAKGMIVDPDDELLKVVNHMLKNAGEAFQLSHVTDSGYLVAEVLKIDEHPLDEKARILELKAGERKLSTVTRYQNFKVGDHIVVAKDGCIQYDGSVFHAHTSKNIAIDCAVCSAKELRIGEEDKAAFLASDSEPGADFFLS